LILYHTTPKENAGSILDKGLLCNAGGYICLSENPYTWWNTPDYAKFAVDISGLEYNHIKFWRLEDDEYTDEVCVWIDVITSDRIKHITH